MISEELKAIVDKFKEQGKMNLGVRTESWTTMGSERSREICFHRKKSMWPPMVKSKYHRKRGSFTDFRY